MTSAGSRRGRGARGEPEDAQATIGLVRQSLSAVDGLGWADVYGLVCGGRQIVGERLGDRRQLDRALFAGAKRTLLSILEGLLAPSAGSHPAPGRIANEDGLMWRPTQTGVADCSAEAGGANRSFRGPPSLRTSRPQLARNWARKPASALRL